MKINNPTADPAKEIDSVVLRPNVSPNCVESNPPRICIMAKTMPDASTPNALPDIPTKHNL